jgi:hypothetical protein
MTRLFRHEGLSFRYPLGWELEREETDDSWTVTLQGPGTAFMTITMNEDIVPLEQMAQEVLDALRSDYPGLEAEPCVEPLAGQMAVGHNIQFFSLDLTNTCRTRSFHSDQGTVLVLCQANDLDWEESEPAFKAVCASLRVEE